MYAIHQRCNYPGTLMCQIPQLANSSRQSFNSLFTQKKQTKEKPYVIEFKRGNQDVPAVCRIVASYRNFYCDCLNGRASYSVVMIKAIEAHSH